MPANQITTISGDTRLTYDANGNLLTDDQGEVLTYNGWNELVSVASTTGTMIATYSYDGAGDLISQTEGGTTTDLYYSGSQDIETRTGVTSTSSGTMATNTIYSPDYQNDVLARDSGGTRLYFTHDANYDVTAVISTAGAVDQRMAYDAYGKVSILTNGGSVTTDGYDLTHLWQGGLRDAATAMYHFGARWYSVTLDQWVSMDPARAGMNWYEPDGDNPINREDPSGLKAQFAANNATHTLTVTLNITLVPFNCPKVANGADMVKRVKTSIETNWNGNWTSGSYQHIVFVANVKYVVVKYNDKGRALNDPFDDNVVKITDQEMRDYVRGGDSGLWSTKSADWVYAHEAGHLMGLADHYTDTANGSVPNQGWAGDIMGDYGGTATQRDINDIVQGH